MRLIKSTCQAAFVALAVNLPAGAQQLNQEITVEHEIVPVKREALKLAVTPELNLPPVTTTPLSIISRGIGISLVPDARVLGPVQSPLLNPDTTHTGYAAIGYWPVYNLGASAGIRGRSRALTGEAWLQFDGKKYTGNNPAFHHIFNPDIYPLPYPLEPAELDYRRNTLSAGGRASVATAAGTLSASLSYSADWYNVPVYTLLEDKFAQDQSFDTFDFSLGFASVPGRGEVDWNLSAAFGLAGYGKDGWSYDRYGHDLYGKDYDPASLARVKESAVHVNGNVSCEVSDNSHIGLDVAFDFQRDNRRSEIQTVDNEANFIPLSNTWTDRNLPIVDLDNDHSQGVVTLTPYWSLGSRSVTTRIGAAVQLSFYSGSYSGKSFHIAPDVSLAWKIASQFALYGRAGGGEHLNYLSRLHWIDYMTAPMLAYGMSHIPFTFEAGFTVGPWSGVALRAYGKYAEANQWLMPAVISHGQTAFMPVDMKGWLVGAELSWHAGRAVDGVVRYELSPDDSIDRGWYLWRDRAHQSVEAELSVRPVSQLTLSGTWQFRDRRKAMLNYYRKVPGGDFGMMFPVEEDTNLGIVADLSLGASWAVTDDFNVWLRCENILGRSWYASGLIPAQGFHGLVGVSCQF